MGTKGRLRRGDLSWIARAASSFPVPLSPVMITGTLVGAASSIRRMARRIASD